MKLLPLPREKRRLLEPLGRAALTCLLTAGSFGGLCAPLPLAITAAAGPGLPGLCCVLGCGLGAFLFLPFQAGLRQLAAAILIFSGSIAFFDTKFFPRRFFRPGLAAALLLLVQSAYLIARPIRLWALCVFCMGLTAAVTDLLLRRPGPAAPAAGGGAVPFGGGFPDRRNIGRNVPDVRFSDAQRPADGTGPGGCLGGRHGAVPGSAGG